MICIGIIIALSKMFLLIVIISQVSDVVHGPLVNSIISLVFICGEVCLWTRFIMATKSMNMHTMMIPL